MNLREFSWKQISSFIAGAILLISLMNYYQSAPGYRHSAELVRDQVLGVLTGQTMDHALVRIWLADSIHKYAFRVWPEDDLEGKGIHISVIDAGDSVIKDAMSDTITFIRNPGWRHTWKISTK